MGGRRNRHHLGQPGRHSALAQEPRPTWRNHQQRGSGQYRHRERCTACERRLPDQQAQHHSGKRRQCGTRTPTRQRHQRDRAHQRRAQHARRGPRDDDEHQQHQPAHGCADPWPNPRPPQHEQYRTDEQRAVGAADGHQVRQSGHPESLGEHRVESARVAVDEARQQAAFLVGQHTRCFAQGRTYLAGAPLPPRRPAEQGRRPAREQRHGQRRFPERGRQIAGYCGALTRQHVSPRGCVCQDQDRTIGGDGTSAGAHPARRALHCNARRTRDASRREYSRVGGHGEQDGDGRVPARQYSEWRRACVRQPAGEWDQHERDAEEQQRAGRCSAPSHGRDEQQAAADRRANADQQHDRRRAVHAREHCQPSRCGTGRQPQIQWRACRGYIGTPTRSAVSSGCVVSAGADHVPPTGR